MRPISFQFPLAACALAVLLSACGGGDATAPGAGSSRTSGFVVDGYLSGATVVCDTNANGTADAGERSVTTDSSGFFQFDPSCNSALLATGGTSMDTGLAFTGKLRAPAGATVVTPLTSLLAAGASESAIKTALGISSDVNLLTDDPARLETGSSTLRQPDLMKKTLVLQQFGQKLSEVFAGLASSGGNAALPEIYSEVVAAIAQALSANPALVSGGTISESVARALIKAAVDRVKTSTSLPATVVAGVAGLNSDSLAQVIAGALKIQGENILGVSTEDLSSTTKAQQQSTAITTFIQANKAGLVAAPSPSTEALGAQLNQQVSGGDSNNLVANGSFSNGTTGWSGNAVDVRTEGGNSFNYANVATAGNPYDVNLSYALSIPSANVKYKLRFKASSNGNRTLFAGIGLSGAPFTNVGETVNLTTTQQTFELSLTSNFASANSRVIFDMGAATGVVVIDDVVLVLDNSSDPVPNNLVTNSNFSSGTTGWSGNALDVRTEGGNSYNFADVATAGNAYDVNLSYVVNVPNANVKYKLRFKASSNRNRTLFAGIGLNEAPYTNVGETVNLNTTPQTFELSLTSNFANANSRVIFDMGADTGVVVIDDVVLLVDAPPPAANLITNGNFSSGSTGWAGAGEIRTESGNSFYYANVEAAGNSYDVSYKYVLSIPTSGVNYKLRFKASSDRNRTMIAGIGLNQDPWTNASQTVNLTTSQQTFELSLTSNFANANSRVFFDMGAAVGVVVIDDVELVLDTSPPPASVGPTVAASAPTALEANVKSIFSDTYTSVAVNEWGPIWSDAAVAIANAVIGGNNYKVIDLLAGKEYGAIDFSSAKFNATAYTHFNMDYWIDTPVPVGQVMNIKLSNHDGAGETNAIENTYTSITGGSWQRISIPLSSFTVAGGGSTSRNNIAQIVITAARANVATTPVKIYFDNMYFSTNP